FDGSKFKKIYAAYSCSLILREVKGLEFEKKLKFQSFFSLRGWFCPSLIQNRQVLGKIFPKLLQSKTSRL
ncbi:MAG: hypothetical protein PUH59_03380, partial [Phascolarctobacterium succinatutens]|uniref:hypothetical protein n=1 Tax=Phascolarctobacterium succinatutens TaxID=626940 RepID=UPI0023F4BBCB